MARPVAPACCHGVGGGGCAIGGGCCHASSCSARWTIAASLSRVRSSRALSRRPSIARVSRRATLAEEGVLAEGGERRGAPLGLPPACTAVIAPSPPKGCCSGEEGSVRTQGEGWSTAAAAAAVAAGEATPTTLERVREMTVSSSACSVEPDASRLPAVLPQASIDPATAAPAASAGWPS